jgi:(1->4)-alpha-D-glucan 1-alpha-D-glucosylmutase
MRIPLATYRIQFNPAFGFRQAQEIMSYLADLGITDLYASPVFKARRGSLHGYDIVDPNQLNPELGRMQDFEELAAEVKAHGMGWLQDVVPNHMAFDHENLMLMDVLENGDRSPFFGFFDIDWHHPDEGLKGRLLAPVLGSLYREALERGEIKLGYDARGLALRYYDWRFPLKISSYATVLGRRLDELRRRLGSNHPDYVSLLGTLYAIKTLDSGEETGNRAEQTRSIKQALRELYCRNRQMREFVEERLREFNGEDEATRNVTLLNALHAEQVFRLSFWKVASEEINYKRFFTINDLISLHVENADVFKATHALILRLVGERIFTGLRIDHIDGLYDPTGYLERVRENAGEAFIVVEKILDFEEELPPFWPVQGTTGYDFLNRVNGLFCKQEHEGSISRTYTRFTGVKTPFKELEVEKKRLIIEQHIAGDVDNLTRLLKTIASRDRYGVDITHNGLNRALVEVMVRFPVYRTYTGATFRQEDPARIRMAVDSARRSNPGLAYELELIERFLLLEHDDHLADEERKQRLHFVMRFQQCTGPLTAKGFEDTLLYVYNRMLSLNEVGGSPERFGLPLRTFHRLQQRQYADWPHSLNATATHDTKRGEDVRARINVLSEVPEEWERRLKTWSRMNRRARQTVKGGSIPDRNDEYFLYQTLVGALPCAASEYAEFVERLKSYLVKSVREAKVHTAWVMPDTHYEEAFTGFAERILARGEDNPFLEDFLRFQKRIAYYGVFNSLSQTLIKMTAPGVPDFYQGTEFWDLNLVDPDNRRPVDFGKRTSVLHDTKQKAGRDVLALTGELLENRADGRIKLFLIYRTLEARKRRAAFFQKASYIPLDTSGSRGQHIVAFARATEDHWAVTVVPRFLAGVVQEGEYPLGPQVWRDSEVVLPGDAAAGWRNVFTGEVIRGARSLRVGEILRHFPVALLVGLNREAEPFHV